MIRELVIATHNPKKGVEMEAILREKLPQLRVLTLADFPGAEEPDETGTSYAENATIKANSASLHTGFPCVADDAGLEIEALPGELGIHSKRFLGEDTPFDVKMAEILHRMTELQGEERKARFSCFVALAIPEENDRHLFSGICNGTIHYKPVGEGGFGYDPIFWHPELGCTMAELTSKQKHEISHRGIVLRKLAVFLERLSGN